MRFYEVSIEYETCPEATMIENAIIQHHGWPRSRFAEFMNVSAGQLSIGILYFLIMIIASDGAWSTIISGLFPALFLAPLMYLLAWRAGWHRFTSADGTTTLGVTWLGFCLFAFVWGYEHNHAASGETEALVAEVGQV